MQLLNRILKIFNVQNLVIIGEDINSYLSPKKAHIKLPENVNSFNLHLKTGVTFEIYSADHKYLEDVYNAINQAGLREEIYLCKNNRLVITQLKGNQRSGMEDNLHIQFARDQVALINFTRQNKSDCKPLEDKITEQNLLEIKLKKRKSLPRPRSTITTQPPPRKTGSATRRLTPLAEVLLPTEKGVRGIYTNPRGVQWNDPADTPKSTKDWLEQYFK